MTSTPFAIHARVEGAYLGIPIAGTVSGFRWADQLLLVIVDLDEPTQLLERQPSVTVTVCVTPDGDDPDGSGSFLYMAKPTSFALRRDAAGTHLLPDTDPTRVVCDVPAEGMTETNTITPETACLSCVGRATTRLNITTEQFWDLIGGKTG